MTDETKKGSEELDFDWDDALSDWEKDVDDRAEAASPPMPQKPAPREVKEPARALYRPPDPNDFKRPAPRPNANRSGSGARPLLPPAEGAPAPNVPPPPARYSEIPVAFDDEEDEDDNTRIATVGDDMLAALLARGVASPSAHQASTRPPPPMPSSEAAPNESESVSSNSEAPQIDVTSSAELQFDEMLAALDSETQAYPSEVPRLVSAIRTPAVPSIPIPTESKRTAPPFQSPTTAPPIDAPPGSSPPSGPQARNSAAEAPKENSGANAPPAPRFGEATRPIPAIAVTNSLPPPPPRTSSAPAGSLRPADRSSGLPPPRTLSQATKQGSSGAVASSKATLGPPQLRSGSKPTSGVPTVLPPSAKSVARQVESFAPAKNPFGPSIELREASTHPAAADLSSDLEGFESELDALLNLDSARPGPAMPTTAPAGAETAGTAPVLLAPTPRLPSVSARNGASSSLPVNPLELEGVAPPSIRALQTEDRLEQAHPKMGEFEDEPLVELGKKEEEDEPETSLVIDADDDLDALAPPESSPVEGMARPVPARHEPARPGRDRGAVAAQRTVRSRKARSENFPLVGRGEAVLRARRDFLLSLVKTVEGDDRARLLLAVAELDALIGEPQRIRERLAEARSEAPRDPVVLRAYRREAITRAAWAEVAASFEAEARLPLSPAERTAAWLGLCELQLRVLGEPAAAEKSAQEACALSPRSFVAALLLAEARSASERHAAAAEAMRRGAEAWNDARGRAALMLTAAREAEKASDLTRAGELYREAAESDPSAIDAWLGVARTAEPQAAASALEKIAALETEGSLADALLRRAAECLLRSDAPDAPRRAMEMLSRCKSLPALRTRAAAAAKTNDPSAQAATLEAWAQASGGADRALALVQLADVQIDLSEFESAARSLHEAAFADAQLGTIRIVREVLAQRSGDRGILDAGDSQGTLAGAAKLALTHAGSERERERIEAAREAGEAPLLAEVLWLDVRAPHDGAVLEAGLRREVDRAPPNQRSGALLILAQRAASSGNPQLAEELLKEARDLAPGDALILRPLGRLLGRSAQAAAGWLEEALASDGARAAFAATSAAALFETSGEATEALRRALHARPTYAPALWLLERWARAEGDGTTLEEVHGQLARLLEGEPVRAASHLVRAAMSVAEAEPQRATEALTRALELTPSDPVLIELARRLGEGLSPAEHARMLLSLRQGAPAPFARAYALEAAFWLQRGEEPARALEIYRELLSLDPSDGLAAAALERAELALGDIAAAAERRFAAVRDAADDAERVHALERLADFDREVRGDSESAALSYSAILEVAPGHRPSLRMLERHHLERDQTSELMGIEERWIQHSTSAADAYPHLRLLARLRLASADATGSAADDLLLRLRDRVKPGPWLSRRAAAAAAAAGATRVEAELVADIAARMPTPLESASASMRAAEARQKAQDDPLSSAEMLEPRVVAAPDHPAAAELLSFLYESGGNIGAAADALERAARAARVPARAAALWLRAGVLFEDVVGDEDRALHALTETSKIDVLHGNVFDRLRHLLELREDNVALAELVDRRVAAGGDVATLAELHALLAGLRESLGDREAAKNALKASLALAPENVTALKKLAELSLAAGAYRDAAEALIRIARIRKDREELRWVFFTLGDIYDRHIPDPRRAEAAYRRVLKLAPADVVSLDRLWQLFSREENWTAAVEVLRELVEAEPDENRKRHQTLALGEALEKTGDVRQAAQVFEAARRAGPPSFDVVKAIAEFHTRQREMPLLAMHLNRAAAEFRALLHEDIGDADSMIALASVLRMRGRTDAARAVASAAAAIRIPVEGITLLPSGAIPGAGGAATDSSLHEIIAPSALPTSARAALRLAGGCLEKAAPFDPRSMRVERLPPRDGSIRPLVLEAAKRFGLHDVDIWVSATQPYACFPVASGPPVTLVIGQNLFSLGDEEREFVLARGLSLAREGYALSCRSSSIDFALAVSGLVLMFDPQHRAPGLDANAVADWSRRIAKQMPRRAVEELGPVVFEMAGSPDYDPSQLSNAIGQLGDRVGLLLTGATPAAVSAIAKVGGGPALGNDPIECVATLHRHPAAISLLEFAISDAHFEARHRTGADRM